MMNCLLVINNMYVYLLDKKIPFYGLLITVGMVISNILAVIMLSRKKMDILDFIILEAYCGLGAFFGAKSLYFLVTIKEIQWNRFFELEYFNQLMQGGFVFYGGLILGIIFVYLAGKFHHINASEYINQTVCYIPLIHCFGRLGCYKAGCCYGMAYDGIFSVSYSPGFFAPANTPLFPVQLVEAAALFLIFLIVFFVCNTKSRYSISVYFILYGITRFILEFFRGDRIRGIYFYLSTSQWISLALILTGIVICVKNHRSVR